MNEVVDYPAVLFFCDFPPSNEEGGSILVSRLLSSFPQDRLSVLTSRRAFKRSTTVGKLNCPHILFPRTSRVGRWGLGRLKELLDWLLFPALVLTGVWQIKHRNIDIMVTIAHGDFVLATALVSALTSTPFVMLVHDDWMDKMTRGPSFLRYCSPKRVFKWVCSRASRIYAVSPPMQEKLRSECGIDAELQMSGADSTWQGESNGRPVSDKRSATRIVYAGNAYGLDSLSRLAAVVKSDRIRELTGVDLELHLYTPLTAEQIDLLEWNHPRVRSNGWVSPDKLREAYAEADILFLPFSFEDAQRRITATSFPAKAAEYIASGKGILICAPPYSSTAQYAKRFGFAEVVTELTEDALTRGILNLGNEEYRRGLQERARQVFEKNHNLAKQTSEFILSLRRIVRERKQITEPGLQSP
jgi:glycosyltransferase involved in cell wall biosynthesis